MTALTAPAATAAPVYVLAHGGHPSDSPEYGVTGYDVIRSTWTGTGPAVLEVTAVTEGATSYAEALALAKAHRGGRRPAGHWGYPATRYACGCRFIALALEPVGSNPAPIFHDLTA